MCGIVEAREIDENINRLPNSGASYTFHGRDVYAYTGARLAAGIIDFEGVGPKINIDEIVELPTVEAIKDGDLVSGTIDVLDVRFGSLWTNISRELFMGMNINYGDKVEVCITKDSREVYKNVMLFATSFAEVNSLDCLAVAINQGSFAKAYNIETGTNWKISIKKSEE